MSGCGKSSGLLSAFPPARGSHTGPHSLSAVPARGGLNITPGPGRKGALWGLLFPRSALLAAVLIRAGLYLVWCRLDGGCCRHGVCAQLRRMLLPDHPEGLQEMGAGKLRQSPGHAWGIQHCVCGGTCCGPDWHRPAQRCALPPLSDAALLLLWLFLWRLDLGTCCFLYAGRA